jgi:cyclic pyranopterin phosphate synthase
MVDIGAKPETERCAVARGVVVMSLETYEAVREGNLKKGDVCSVAEIAGVQAAKRTAELIPLCHNIPLSHVDVRVALDQGIPGVEITATARTVAPTGVEMEALCAVAVAALTVYDMIKAIERGARITDIRLIKKHGGTSGAVVLED